VLQTRRPLQSRRRAALPYHFSSRSHPLLCHSKSSGPASVILQLHTYINTLPKPAEGHPPTDGLLQVNRSSFPQKDHLRSSLPVPACSIVEPPPRQLTPLPFCNVPEPFIPELSRPFWGGVSDHAAFIYPPPPPSSQPGRTPGRPASVLDFSPPPPRLHSQTYLYIHSAHLHTPTHTRTHTQHAHFHTSTKHTYAS
jgi:hypothetical protein